MTFTDDELIKKVMESNDFTSDEKVTLIKALTSKDKEYVYIPYERKAPDVVPNPYPSYPQYPITPIITCSTETLPCNNIQYSSRCSTHKRH